MVRDGKLNWGSSRMFSRILDEAGSRRERLRTSQARSAARGKTPASPPPPGATATSSFRPRRTRAGPLNFQEPPPGVRVERATGARPSRRASGEVISGRRRGERGIWEEFLSWQLGEAPGGKWEEDNTGGGGDSFRAEYRGYLRRPATETWMDGSSAACVGRSRRMRSRKRRSVSRRQQARHALASYAVHRGRTTARCATSFVRIMVICLTDLLEISRLT
jgi:hypothetical protein